MSKLSFVILALASVVFGVWAFIATSDLRTAIVGAEKLEGSIAKIENRRLRPTLSRKKRYQLKEPPPDYCHVYVTFTTADGQEVTRPAQADGPEPDDILFHRETFTDTGLAVGDTVTLLYHPELGDLVWIDQFWLLWVFPLFLCLGALVGTVVVVGIAFVAFADARGSKRDASS